MTAMTGDFSAIRSDYHEQVGMIEATRRAFANFANFQGRANRGEYWWFALTALLMNVATQAADWTFLGVMHGGFPVLSIAWALISFVPSLSLAVRRLHDIDRSGWSFLVVLIPLVGIFILIKRMATKGEATPNRFG